MTAIWSLLWLTPFVAIYILWRSYQRRVGQHEQESSVRWEELVSTARAGQAVPAAVLPAEGGAVQAPAPAAPQGPAPFTRRTRTLDPVQTLLYYLLKNTLPDHEVMPRVTLDSVLEMAPGQPAGADPQGRQLAQQVVDFLVCDKALRPVAVIDLRTVPSVPDFRIRCLAQANIRYLQIQRTALPKRDQVRELVLGA